MPKKETPEGRLTKVIRKVLRFNDIWHYKVHGGLGQEPGIPDLVCCYNGLFVGIEVKIAPKKLSPKQQEKKELIEAAGGMWITAYTLDDVIKGLGLDNKLIRQ